MSCKKCKNKEDYTCGKKHNARCIDYEGDLHDNTSIEECETPDIEDVIEDINEELNFLHSQTDLTNLGSCEAITYPGLPEDLTIPQALLTHENIICELVAHTGLGEPEPCPNCDEPCSVSSEACCEVLVNYGFGAGEFFTSVASYPDWMAPTVPGYEDLVTTITKTGTYKITVDIGCAEEDINGKAYIGISKNGVAPSANAFEQYDILPRFFSHTYHFIITAVATDILSIKFKSNPAGVIVVDGIKMIVEKVG